MRDPIELCESILKAEGFKDWRAEWSKASPSICLRKGKRILLRHNITDQYEWQMQEEVIHEIAHIRTEGDKMHGRMFYREYVMLLTRYIVDEVPE